MIKIKPHIGVNDYVLGSEKINSNPDLHQDFKLEYKNNKLIAVSFKDTNEFLIDDEIVNIKYGSDWLSKQNPYFDGNLFIFPEINIAVWGLEAEAKGNEVTVYADEVQDIYEKRLNNCIRYNELISSNFTHEDKLVITPYKGCGEIIFGERSEEIIQKIGKPKKTAGNSVKLTLYWDNMILSFKENKLIQITLEHPSDVILNNEEISSKGNLCSQFDAVDKLANRAYTVLFDFGIAFSGYSDKSGPETIVVFDSSLKEFWSNTKRPLIL